MKKIDILVIKDEKTYYGAKDGNLAIIVPCYNEQEALPLFYKEASKVLEKLDYDYKLLLINDGSKDNTLSIMKSIAEKDEHVKYLSFSRNFGKEAAMYAGFCNANADYVCVMDADMQDPPSLLPEMLEILHTQDYDSVATRRKNREGEPPIRSWFAHRFMRSSIKYRMQISLMVQGIFA